ncbi:light-harvesting protein [Rhodomicrobium sp. Az07]|uniref:light-harvesting protein n=1 Tax=Rhodomicrobium sp. Az07 TaxID=2839034 RepID=UPI001BE6D940|nr:light-harvesting protein [Rhodomicrobium sp. Az07]MBT3071859.1 light-harvesting protein [Rhodomicrobium sp. Az07]
MADTDGQAAIWLYVRPSIGIPHFLGAVAMIALVVHLGVLGHTTLLKKFFNGEKLKAASISYVLPSNS